MANTVKLFFALIVLIFLSSFAFADMVFGPAEIGLELFIFGIFGLVVIALITGGIFLVFKIYTKVGKKSNTESGEKKINKAFKILVSGLVIILVILFVVYSVAIWTLYFLML